jgi:hypothetical protein
MSKDVRDIQGDYTTKPLIELPQSIPAPPETSAILNVRYSTVLSLWDAYLRKIIAIAAAWDHGGIRTDNNGRVVYYLALSADEARLLGLGEGDNLVTEIWVAMEFPVNGD